MRYIITETELPNANPGKWVKQYEDDAVMIYENIGVMDRAFTLPQYSEVEYLGNGGFQDAVQRADPRTNVLLPTTSDDNTVPSLIPVPGLARPATNQTSGCLAG